MLAITNCLNQTRDFNDINEAIKFINDKYTEKIHISISLNNEVEVRTKNNGVINIENFIEIIDYLRKFIKPNANIFNNKNQINFKLQTQIEIQSLLVLKGYIEEKASECDKCGTNINIYSKIFNFEEACGFLFLKEYKCVECGNIWRIRVKSNEK